MSSGRIVRARLQELREQRDALLLENERLKLALVEALAEKRREAKRSVTSGELDEPSLSPEDVLDEP